MTARKSIPEAAKPCSPTAGALRMSTDRRAVVHGDGCAGSGQDFATGFRQSGNLRLKEENMEPCRSSKVARLDSEQQDFGPSHVLAPVVSNSIPSFPTKKDPSANVSHT
jgi:hypothetical protein